MLEIEFTDIIAQPTAFSAIMPGLGFLRDAFTDPFLVHWRIADGWATSAEIPGVRIPGAPFMGVSAVAPSAAVTAEWTAREHARSVDKGGSRVSAGSSRCCADWPVRHGRTAYPATAREWRQFRREAADEGRQAFPARLSARRLILHGRLA